MAPSSLESPEEAISLLQLLKADQNVCLAQFSLLQHEITQSAACVSYYMLQAEKVRKQLEHAEHAVGFGQMVITKSGFLYEATVGQSHC